MAGPEYAPKTESSAEKQPLLEQAPEIHRGKIERAPEQSPEETERNIEQAKAEANKEAISGREVNRGEQKTSEDAPRVTLKTRDESYKHTMKQVQNDMSAPARTFSKVIHHPVVEKVSDAVGSTIARPDAILSGSLFAFLLVLALYALARYDGFSLSGFETIAAFIVGWIVGVIFDFLRVMITGKRQ